MQGVTDAIVDGSCPLILTAAEAVSIAGGTGMSIVVGRKGGAARRMAAAGAAVAGAARRLAADVRALQDCRGETRGMPCPIPGRRRFRSFACCQSRGVFKNRARLRTSVNPRPHVCSFSGLTAASGRARCASSGANVRPPGPSSARDMGPIDPRAVGPA